ncbi:MAG: MFS transporter [Ancylobacter novellus]|jgi:MFS family permease|uniref:MFS transporter n=1 Tax=Ancylobacter novellus TaxID=921 RepID=A0A2W5R5T7_ANCNO|nr:MAG: MFS transporter [Ancylobacter novellus]
MQTDQKTVNRVVLSSLIGATIEWYDFFIYGVLAGIVLNKLYFPSEDPTISLMLTYATFALGFLTRPLGGIVFGHFGDKVGRKSVLVITLMIMGISTFAIGLIPTFDQIGLWAPALLLTMRIFQGIGLGGEWGGAVLMAYEYAPPSRRGFYTSIPQMGLSIGILLSAGTLAVLSAIMSNDAFMSWGWRIGFLLSVLLIFVGMWIRLQIFETPAFSQIKASHEQAPLPIVEMFRRHMGNVVLGLGARHVDGVFFNVFAVFSVSYLVDKIGITRNDALVALMVGAAVLTICIPIAGHLSDKMSRPKLYGIAALVSSVSIFPAFWLMKNSDGNLTAIWAAIVIPYGIIYSAVYGNVAAFLCDLFDAKVRYSGISFVYQMTSAVAGMTALICTYLVKIADGEPWLVCWYVLGSGVLSTVCALIIASQKRNLTASTALA